MMADDLNLHDRCDSVRTREDFVAFARALAKDLRDRSESWENTTLEHYLDSLAAWTEVMDRAYANRGMRMPDSPSWNTMAEILMAAKHYE